MGVVVVPGDFDGAPFHLYQRDPDAVPSDVILVTDALYPEIADLFGSITVGWCRKK